MVRQYRKKPVVIKAIQWTGNNLSKCKCFLGGSFLQHRLERHIGGANEILIRTLEGQHVASVGDYIIEGVQGEHYPCKPDVFELTYESTND